MDKNTLLYELIKQDNNIELIKEKLKQAYRDGIKEQFIKENDEYWKSNKLIKNEEGFKFAGYTRRTNYYYFVSNIGRFLLVKSGNEPSASKVYKKEIFNENDYWIIFQNPDTLCLDFARLKEEFKKEHDGYVYNSSNPLYNYVGETWLKEEKDKVSNRFKDERIELHHIDGNNMNCCTNNLIYLPNSIHACVHVVL